MELLDGQCVPFYDILQLAERKKLNANVENKIKYK